jgi:hypothetical protein
MIKRLCILFLACVPLFAEAQEFRCSVQISSQQVQGTNRQVFQTLQGALNEFINGRAWSGYKFSNNERIECSMLINIQELVGSDEFKGSLQIQVRRPVFNTSYNTVLFNYVDNDIDFKYVEFQPLEFSETSNLSNLTSIIAFYAYVILGLDFDSYALNSGTEFYHRAEKIMNNAQNAQERGWRSGESTSRKNRYWLISSILNEDFSPVREFIYKYHRQGLDVMYDKLVDGRAAIAESLILLQNVFKARPDPFMHFLQIILDAKSDEFVNVFQESTDDEKRRVMLILNQIDPTHVDKYRKITTGTSSTPGSSLR